MALILVITLGGFIAYYGDLQGRRWGKKRVSWFGMRPKHTAILITSITGAFISLLSITILMIISPPIRQVVLQGEQAIAEKSRLDLEISDGRKKAAQAQIDLQNVERKEEISRSELLLAQHQLADSQKQVAISGKRAGTLLREVERDQKQVSEAAMQVARLSQERKRLTRQNIDIANQNIRLTLKEMSLTKANKSLALRNSSLQKDNSQLTSQNSGLTTQNSSLLHENQVLDSANQAQIDANNRSEEKASAVLEEKKKQLADVQTELESLQQTYGIVVGNSRLFSNSYLAMRQGKIAMRAGSELARTIIPAHLSSEMILQQLQKLIQRAGDAALQCGGSAGSNGFSVQVAPLPIFTLSGGPLPGEQETLSNLANNLAGSDKPQLVVVRLFSNTLEGEQALVTLSSSPVINVLSTGQILASQVVDSDQPLEGIELSLAQFLQTDVRKQAIQLGIIPAVDPQSGKSEVGQFSPFQLMHTAQRLRDMRGKVLVEAAAAETISSADLLNSGNLHLLLERVKSKN